MIEPHGSRGADIESVCGTVVGEIKHAQELARDLKSSYWSSWNSSQSFGGKASDYHIADDFNADTSDIGSRARGWIAVIYGQLNHYRRQNDLEEGWIVFERYDEYYNSLKEGLAFLSNEGKIVTYNAFELNEIGFLQILFTE